MRKLLLLACLVSGFSCRSGSSGRPPLSRAVFTPDNSAIVFSASQNGTCFLWQADIASGSARRLTHEAAGCESDPIFSPDGKQLAFMRSPQPGTHAALIVARSDGTAPRVLVAEDADNLEPNFVPHSNQILFLRSGAFEHYSPVAGDRRHKFDLYSADLTVGRVTQLTHQHFYEISRVSVSGDGTQVLLTVDDDGGDTFLVAPITNADEPTLRLRPKVTSDPVIYDAVWMPDASAILFSGATVPSGGGNYDYNVYRLILASGAFTQLTHLKGLLDGLSVSPDGTKAVLLNHGVYSVLELASSKLTAITLR